MVSPSIVSSKRGLWAVKWSFIILFITAFLQVGVVIISNSVALLADTIHNIGDAATAIPLGIAFALARLKPSKRFTYGYGRVEDIAGVNVVLIILFSAIVAGYQSIDRFFNPAEVQNLWAVIAASVVGFLGNEGVALFRIKVGKEIGSAALIADGYHARVDGWTSLAVLFGALGVWIGFPMADPIIGLGITIAILFIVWESSKAVFTRLLDGVEPEIIDEIKHTTHHVKGVSDVGDIRARWIGHRLHAEINVAVNARCSVNEGHEIAKEVRHTLLHKLPHLGNVIVHIDPDDKVGESFHHIAEHKHDEFVTHLH
jgi:cation diffusion facilitator family transporter